MTEPTPGALRAARVLMQEHFGFVEGNPQSNEVERTYVAQIIDRETGARALLEAADRFVKDIDSYPLNWEMDTMAHGLAVCLDTDSGDRLRAAIDAARRA